MQILEGDILKAKTDYIAIPVNIVGVAGAGLAKQWALQYPDLEKEYKAWCQRRALGKASQQVIIYEKFLMFPTKKHYKDKSDLTHIKHELGYMYWYMLPHYKDRSIALPMLGAGLGGLNSEDVFKLIEKKAIGAEYSYDIYTTLYKKEIV